MLAVAPRNLSNAEERSDSTSNECKDECDRQNATLSSFRNFGNEELWCNQTSRSIPDEGTAFEWRLDVRHPPNKPNIPSNLLMICAAYTSFFIDRRWELRLRIDGHRCIPNSEMVSRNPRRDREVGPDPTDEC
uniref:MATH domain-containing protein n=1 Tax=Ascaris lumbricoides TaxID=6252 RepID=A0A0M3IC37_ASCLU